MKLLGLLTAMLVLARSLHAAETQSTQRPNFIFILTDDFGWGDARAFGHPYLKTPNIDRLAREGTCFRQFYVASPVCSPSRAALMTAQFPARLRMHGHLARHDENVARFMPDWLDPKVVTVTRLLQQAGYSTAHFGKWHLGRGPGAPTPGEYGIDVHKTHNSNGPQLGAEEVIQFHKAHPDWKNTDGSHEELPFYRAKSTRMIVDETLKFVRNHQDQPFYVNVWTLLPHAPLQPTPRQLAVYRDLAPRADDPAFGKWMQGYLAHAKDLKSQMQVYAASVTDLDEQIGRLLDGLAELGLAQNTIVFFSSDNGPEDYCVGNAANAGVGSPGPLRGRKRSLYEGGVRTPLLVRWPGKVGAGAVDEETVLAGVDFLPTVCKLAGVNVPNSLKPDGEDVSDRLLGIPGARQTPLFWEWRFDILGEKEFVSPMLAVRDANWKLLLNPGMSRVELYDIPNDMEERKNVASQHPDVVETLSVKALKWQKSLPPDPIRTKLKKAIEAED